LRQGEAINGSPWMMRPSVWSYVTLSLEPDINLPAAREDIAFPRGYPVYQIIIAFH